jgi:hypothetical protein
VGSSHYFVYLDCLRSKWMHKFLKGSVGGWMHKWALCNHYAPKEEHNVHTAFYGFLQSLIFKQVDSYMFFFFFSGSGT